MKVDQQGKFLPFPGLTIIAPVILERFSIWSRLYNELSSNLEITKYYALLPLHSYHMTTNNLIVKSVCPCDWDQYIEQSLLQFAQMSRYLVQHSFAPQITVYDYYVDRAIQLDVALPIEQYNKIISTAFTFSIQGGIPDPFHVTLAYQYREIPKNIEKRLKSTIKIMLNNIVNSVQNDEAIILKAPALHYFFDMSGYIPWDTQSNPFRPITPPPYSEYRDISIFGGNCNLVSLEQDTPIFTDVGTEEEYSELENYNSLVRRDLMLDY